MSDISTQEYNSIMRDCTRQAIHEATDLYEGFTPEWYKAIEEIKTAKFYAITTPPKSKCCKCGRVN